MPFIVTEQLTPKNPSVILNSLEEAKDFLIYEGMTIEENIAILDNFNDPFWVANRESLIETMTNVDFQWDQNMQMLTRTLVFSSESAYVNLRRILNRTMPAMERDLSVLNTDVI